MIVVVVSLIVVGTLECARRPLALEVSGLRAYAKTCQMEVCSYTGRTPRRGMHERRRNINGDLRDLSLMYFPAKLSPGLEWKI